jgi:hypothetical protein
MYVGVLAAVVGWLVSDKYESILKEVYVPKSKYHSGVCLEGLRKTMKELSLTRVLASIRTGRLWHTGVDDYRCPTTCEAVCSNVM